MAIKIAPGDPHPGPPTNRPTEFGAARFKPGESEVFAAALRALESSRVPVLIAGAFASHAYTGIWRDTKDLDVFLRPTDVRTALRALSDAGFETELRDPTWIAKAWKEPYLIDLIFGNGNRRLQVDDTWIEHGEPIEICGVPARLIAIEDLIVSKAFIAKRDRFDGADIAHLILCQGRWIRWDRVLERLQNDRLLVLWHLVFFAYAYPRHMDLLPRELMQDLFGELGRQWDHPPETGFRGTLIDAAAFAIDVADWGYRDPRPAEADIAVIVEAHSDRDEGRGDR